MILLYKNHNNLFFSVFLFNFLFTCASAATKHSFKPYESPDSPIKDRPIIGQHRANKDSTTEAVVYKAAASGPQRQPESESVPKPTIATVQTAEVKAATSGILTRFKDFLSSLKSPQAAVIVDTAQPKAPKQMQVEQPKAAEPKPKKFAPDPVRQAKINQGTEFVAKLAQSPDEVAKLLPPRPADIVRLHDPVQRRTVSAAELRKIQQKPEVQKYLQEYQRAVELIGEHFFAVAKSKDPKYKSGTIVIEDKNGEIHKFLQGYVQVSQALKTGSGYERISSHFGSDYKYGSEEAKQAGKPTQYGIDLKEPIMTTTSKKPSDEEIRKHLLFGKVTADKNLLFMKFETHGLGNLQDTIIHSTNYVRRKGAMVIEKIQAKLEGSNDSSTKKNDGQEGAVDIGTFKIKDSRENTPKIILEDYRKLLEKSGLSKAEQKSRLDAAKARGVSRILEDCKGDPKYGEFVAKIQRTYESKGSLAIRKGNEVIIRSEELQALKVPDKAPEALDGAGMKSDASTEDVAKSEELKPAPSNVPVYRLQPDTSVEVGTQ